MGGDTARRLETATTTVSLSTMERHRRACSSLRLAVGTCTTTRSRTLDRVGLLRGRAAQFVSFCVRSLASYEYIVLNERIRLHCASVSFAAQNACGGEDGSNMR